MLHVWLHVLANSSYTASTKIEYSKSNMLKVQEPTYIAVARGLPPLATRPSVVLFDIRAQI